MPKLSFMKFYPADWINDTRNLSIEAKGCLIDILCLMWNAKERGKWSGTFQEFARVTGSPWEAAPRLITELDGTLHVTRSNISVTLENRRMVREETYWKNNSERQARHRRNANSNRRVTAKMLDSSRLLNITLDNTNDTASDIEVVSTPQKQQEEWFGRVWNFYPPKGRLGRKNALRHFVATVKTLEDAKRCAAALDRYLISRRVKEGFIQNASTWFNNWQDWENYVEEKDGTVNC